MSNDNTMPASSLPRGSARRALSLKTYRAASRVMGPIVGMALKKRLKQGKEDPERIGERRGIAGRDRPEGRLVWIHGASVGESLSVLPLVRRLSEQDPESHFLVTTGTVTSARLMESRLPDNAFHQYAPIDHPDYVTQFLDHWRPDACLFVESELWPNLIHQTSDRHIPMALVNGRISPKSYASWITRRSAAKELLSSFSVLMAQDSQNQERLADLRGGTVNMHGNLKLAAAPLPVDEAALEAFRAKVGDRPVWLAASTHPGEEMAVFEAHRQAEQRFPDLLTIIAPRHPERGGEIQALAASRGLALSRRSLGDEVTDRTQIYLADTLGELGLFYRLVDIAFVGGSLIEVGGHNPLEPALLNCSILYGPNIFNFADTYRDMRASGGTAMVRNERDLAASIVRLLMDEKTRLAMAGQASNWALASAEQVLIDIIEALDPVLPPAPDAGRKAS